MNAFFKWCILFASVFTFAFTSVGMVAAEPVTTTFTGQSIVVAKSKNVKRVHYKKRSRAKRRAALKRKQRRERLAIQRANELGENYDGSGALNIASNKALVINQNTGEVIYSKNSNIVSPIASITKLMTAMVILDMQQPLDEEVYISEQDVDTIKNTRSRLEVGTKLYRGELLILALMSSENRAAFALASNYPGGQAAFVRAMNTKAKLIGLEHTWFADPTGLQYRNVSTAEDLATMVQVAYQYPEIRMATTTAEEYFYLEGKETATRFGNTNSLVSKAEWQIGLSKTGFINEAGRCLVMQATVEGEPLVFVFLDSSGRYNRIGDANRVRKWVEYNNRAGTPATVTGQVDHQTTDTVALVERVAER